MPQPNRAQWRLIWLTAIVLILAWPPADEASLGIKALRWIVDPRDTLPRLPDELPMGLGDNGDAVAAHDEQANEYYRLTESSAWIRTRVKVKELADPLPTATERQILVGLAMLAGLGVWRLSGNRTDTTGT